MSKDTAYPWLKLHTDILDDPKIIFLSERAAWRYIQLYALAGRFDAGGSLISGGEALTLAQIARILRVDPTALLADIAELREAGLIREDDGCLCVTRFEDEQGPAHATKREAWKERQRKNRAKSKKEAEKELREEKEEEGEEEVTYDSRVSHASVTRDNTSSPPSLTLQERLEKSIENVDHSRLAQCIAYYAELASERGWYAENEEAILELYAPGGLEGRQLRVRKPLQDGDTSSDGGMHPARMGYRVHQPSLDEGITREEFLAAKRKAEANRQERVT